MAQTMHGHMAARNHDSMMVGRLMVNEIGVNRRGSTLAAKRR